LLSAKHKPQWRNQVPPGEEKQPRAWKAQARQAKSNRQCLAASIRENLDMKSISREVVREYGRESSRELSRDTGRDQQGSAFTKISMFPSDDSLPALSDNLTQALTALRAEDPGFSKVIVTRKSERGDVVATADEMASKMYVLMNGRVNLVCANAEGRRLVIATLEPGAIFGEGAVAASSDPNVFAEAADSSTLWVIPASEARNLTMQYPIISWGLLQTYGRRLVQVENSLEDVAYKKLPERLADLLVQLNTDASDVIKGISHQALADYLGTYRETVSAILRDFKRQGLVELGYRRISLLDMEELKIMAGIWEY
jgi:CRP-like cAMP-binding protein